LLSRFCPDFQLFLMQWKGEVTSLGKGRKVQECEETEVGVRKKKKKKKRNLFATNTNNIKQEKHNIKVSS